MAKNTNKITDFQLSTWGNTTHIGIDKLRFAPGTLPWIQAAIENLLKKAHEYKDLGVPVGESLTEKIPYTVFPAIRQALKPYDKKHSTTHAPDFLVLYHKHSPIGVIKEDNPKTLAVCPKCEKKIVVEKKDAQRKMFRQGKPINSYLTICCPEHGEVEPAYCTI